LLVEIVLDPYALDPDPIVSVSPPVLAFKLILEPWLLTASEVTPSLLIVIELAPLETEMEVPPVIVLRENPLDEAISN
tara:strand:+ start:1369 stop:1602 length:234 start_codon:yes stop_codon:yes gene_type:complete